MKTIARDLQAPVASPEHAGAIDLAVDHAQRVIRALAGFGVHGASWLRPWLSYCISPLVRRVTRDRVAKFAEFNARVRECDLYTYTNVFEDYPVAAIDRALDEVEMVVDLGANVGAFSYLIDALCRRKKIQRPIVAIEPSGANIRFLRTQPFAGRLNTIQAAVGPHSGRARLVRGQNSVTDHVDFSNSAEGDLIDVISLDSLCNRRALVKMDVEGAEWEILARGLPDHVRHLVLEWHVRPGPAAGLAPNDIMPGDWTMVSRDLFGASMWHFRASAPD